MSTRRNPRLRRYWTATVTGVASVAVASATASALLNTNDAESRSYDVINTAAINASSTTIGISDPYLYNMSQADIDKTLDTMLGMGVKDVRIMIPWAGVEMYKGKYNWSAVDRVVNSAATRGMGVLGIINSTPYWAATNKVPISGHPDPNVYADFAGKVAQRYKGKVAAYEVWNEPNGFKYWSNVDPVKYTTMLKAAYSTIKAQDPTATVIGGVVGAGLSFGNIAMNPVTFVDKMYQNGAGGYFDALSFHPYHYKLKFSAGKTVTNSPYKQLEALRALMVKNGDSSKLIWNTEYGQPSTAALGGEATQAAFIQDMLTTWSKLSYVGPVYLFTTRDLKANSTVTNDNFGLFKFDWTPKASATVTKNQIIANAQAQLAKLNTAVSTTLQSLNQSVSTTLQSIQASATAQRTGTTTLAAAPVTTAPVAQTETVSQTTAPASSTSSTTTTAPSTSSSSSTTGSSSSTGTASSTGSASSAASATTGSSTSTPKRTLKSAWQAHKARQAAQAAAASTGSSTSSSSSDATGGATTSSSASSTDSGSEGGAGE
jgi:hypothetical protein